MPYTEEKKNPVALYEYVQTKLPAVEKFTGEALEIIKFYKDSNLVWRD